MRRRRRCPYTSSAVIITFARQTRGSKWFRRGESLLTVRSVSGNRSGGGCVNLAAESFAARETSRRYPFFVDGRGSRTGATGARAYIRAGTLCGKETGLLYEPDNLCADTVGVDVVVVVVVAVGANRFRG